MSTLDLQTYCYNLKFREISQTFTLKIVGVMYKNGRELYLFKIGFGKYFVFDRTLLDKYRDSLFGLNQYVGLPGFFYFHDFKSKLMNKTNMEEINLISFFIRQSEAYTEREVLRMRFRIDCFYKNLYYPVYHQYLYRNESQSALIPKPDVDEETEKLIAEAGDNERLLAEIESNRAEGEFSLLTPSVPFIRNSIDHVIDVLEEDMVKKNLPPILPAVDSDVFIKIFFWYNKILQGYRCTSADLKQAGNALEIKIDL